MVKKRLFLWSFNKPQLVDDNRPQSAGCHRKRQSATGCFSARRVPFLSLIEKYLSLSS
jgi:hypothetical protein